MRNHIMALVAPCLIVACAPDVQTKPKTDTIARGEYLVALAGCHDCHTPMTQTGPDMTRALQGAELGFAPLVEIPWAAAAPPLAGIPAHYTEDEFTLFLQTGARPAATQTLPPMPQYRMSDEDARAVTAYIKSLPPNGG